MEQHIALLRGINVGGKNKISMPLLKTAFEEIGFSHIKTYINSGNVIFSSEDTDKAMLQRKCRQIIEDTFQLDIPTAIISAKDLLAALNHAPSWWNDDGESKHIAIFVIAPADAGDLIEKVGIKPDYEKIAKHGQIIFWSAPLKTYSRTKWSKVVATPVYNSITIRNANTAKKLLELCQFPT